MNYALSDCIQELKQTMEIMEEAADKELISEGEYLKNSIVLSRMYTISNAKLNRNDRDDRLCIRNIKKNVKIYQKELKSVLEVDITTTSFEDLLQIVLKSLVLTFFSFCGFKLYDYQPNLLGRFFR